MASRCHVNVPGCEPSSHAGDVYAHNILVGDSAKPTLLDYGELTPAVLPGRPCTPDQMHLSFFVPPSVPPFHVAFRCLRILHQEIFPSSTW